MRKLLVLCICILIFTVYQFLSIQIKSAHLQILSVQDEVSEIRKENKKLKLLIQESNEISEHIFSLMTGNPHGPLGCTIPTCPHY